MCNVPTTFYTMKSSCLLYAFAVGVSASSFFNTPEVIEIVEPCGEFTYVTQAASYLEAAEFCRRSGSYLATINELRDVSPRLLNLDCRMPNVQVWASVPCQLATITRAGCVEEDIIANCQLGEPRFSFVCRRATVLPPSPLPVLSSPPPAVLPEQVINMTDEESEPVQVLPILGNSIRPEAIEVFSDYTDEESEIIEIFSIQSTVSQTVTVLPTTVLTTATTTQTLTPLPPPMTTTYPSSVTTAYPPPTTTYPPPPPVTTTTTTTTPIPTQICTTIIICRVINATPTTTSTSTEVVIVTTVVVPGAANMGMKLASDSNGAVVPSILAMFGAFGAVAMLL